MMSAGHFNDLQNAKYIKFQSANDDVYELLEMVYPQGYDLLGNYLFEHGLITDKSDYNTELFEELPGEIKGKLIEELQEMAY